MSKFSTSKVSATLVGISLLVATMYPAFAEDATTSSTRKLGKPVSLSQKIDIREDQVKNEIESLREKAASRTAALKLKLSTFRDQKKATISARLSNNLNQINENQTTQMQKHLSEMSKILNRLETRISRGTPDIKDVAAARSAVASASATIATVSAAVTAQAQKDYTIQVTSEGRVGLDAKKQRDLLHTDLLAARKMVIDAKQSVANAIRIAKSGPAPVGAGLEKEGTASGQQ